MVETIKLNKILPSLSPARKVKRTDPRGRGNQQSYFNETFERKQKKKKKDNHERSAHPERDTKIRDLPRDRQADWRGVAKCRPSCDSSCSRIIDIRV